MQSIMLATDGSPSADDATREAISLASELHLPLTIVSVAQYDAPAFGYYGVGYGDLAREVREMQRAQTTRVLATVRERAEAAALVCETVALEGLPGERICEAAGEHDIRLIVMGAHGWGRLGRMIHGSVSEYVLHHAHVPVLVVAGDPATRHDTESESVEARS